MGQPQTPWSVRFSKYSLENFVNYALITDSSTPDADALLDAIVLLLEPHRREIEAKLPQHGFPGDTMHAGHFRHRHQQAIWNHLVRNVPGLQLAIDSACKLLGGTIIFGATPWT